MSKEILMLCHEAATQIYGRKKPSRLYALNVALLLAGTAATESHLKDRRQIGYSLSDGDGAWGLWQTEALPLGDNINFLKARPTLALNSSNFLHGEKGEISAILSMGTHGLLRLCAGWDRFAILMARIHYMRFPAPVPGNNMARARYYKKYYNTSAGKGSPEKYMRDYRRLISPYLKAGL